MEPSQYKDFLISYAIDRMTEYLIEDHNLSIELALSTIYNSDTYKKLVQTENDLYIQSSAYIYELLDKEYRTGKTT